MTKNNDSISFCSLDILFYFIQVKSFSGRRVTGRTSWEGPEKSTAENIFRDNIDEGVLPSRSYCQLIVSREPTLKRRTADQLKAWVNNQINKKKRLLEQANQSLEREENCKKIRSSY